MSYFIIEWFYHALFLHFTSSSDVKYMSFKKGMNLYKVHKVPRLNL
jgi:hypothetical protein